MKLHIRTTCLLAATLATMLAGCEIKREGEPGPEPETVPEAVSGEAVEPAADAVEAPVSSIIRPETAPEQAKQAAPAQIEPLELTIPFPDGGYELSARAEQMLEGVLGSDQLAQGWSIVLRGHTDSAGTDRGNLIASEKRAETVAGWIVGQGVDKDRIEIIGLGEQRPLAPNAKLDGTPDEAGRALNRRVDLWLGPADVDGGAVKEGGKADAPATGA